MNTIVIGAGQAGLSTGYHLRKLGRPSSSSTATPGSATTGAAPVGHPAGSTPRPSTTACPDCRSPADRWTFPGKDEVADYLESYAAHFDLPVRIQHPGRPARTRGRPVGRRDVGSEHVTATTSSSRPAPSAGRRTSRTSPVDLDPAIRQLHSSEYRRPGAARSPARCWWSARRTRAATSPTRSRSTHQTVLCGRDPGQLPVRPEPAAVRAVFPVLVFLLAGTCSPGGTPIGRKEMEEVRFHGGPMIRVKRADLPRAASSGSTTGWPVSRTGLPVLERRPGARRGERRLGHRLPPGLRLDRGSGHPARTAGRASCAAWSRRSPGLFFCGLSFQYAFARWCCSGSAGTREYVAGRIAARSRADRSLAPPPERSVHARGEGHADGRRRRSGAGQRRRSSGATGRRRTTGCRRTPA